MVCNFTPPTHTPTIDHMLIKREGYPNRKKSRSLNKKNTHTTTHTNGSHEVILTSCHDVRKENLASSLLPHWDIFEIAYISTTPPPLKMIQMEAGRGGGPYHPNDFFLPGGWIFMVSDS